jgi:hypothetical protein
MSSTIKLNYDYKALASVVNYDVMPQFGAYLTIVIYDCKTAIVQATGVWVIKLLLIVNDNLEIS